MALLDGHIEAQERAASPAQYLGKRKRTTSAESGFESEAQALPVQQNLKDALQLIKRHDPSARILSFPLSSRGEDGRMIKRQRTELPDQENDNIESRIVNATYQSLGDLMADLNEVKTAVFDKEPTANGNTDSNSSVKEQLSIVWETLSNIQSTTNNTSSFASLTASDSLSQKHKALVLPSNQVLSLRSQTDHGMRQLFSGLPENVDSTNVDARRLPNGFELTETVTVDKNNLRGRDSRKFGDVFAPHRNIKTLEMPRGSRALRGNLISFIQPLENITTSSKNDYRFANLTTGQWIKYAIMDRSTSEFRERSQDNTLKANALFKATFSTFAPNTDNSHSVVTDFDRSQQWWKKHGKPVAQKAMFETTTQSGAPHVVDEPAQFFEKDIEDMITNFLTEIEQGEESEDVLSEVSELIETLSSYQSIRNLEIARGPSSASKPSRDEQNTYELLRNQLQLLVSSLPPFAVAKLNGDQLEELNISTQILVSAPEFVGTAQVDDHTLRRNRAAQAATSAVGRTGAPIPSRNTYSTPASAYNAQSRAYNNVVNSTYGARSVHVPMYSTPRPTATPQTGAFAQTQYRPNGPGVHTPSVQQFQRPMVNGYGGTATPPTQSPYMQRPSQPGYQQRAQDSAVYSRSDASHKPILNGDIPQYQHRQYATPNSNHAVNMPNTAGQQRVIADNVKQRQASGTPQPQVEIAEGVTTAIA